MKTVFGSIGSVCSATHRMEDLIPAFRDELARLAEKAKCASHLDLVATVNGTLQKADEGENAGDYWDSEDASMDLESLTDALNEYAPPFCYFGTHEGDGADFGFWWSSESFDTAVEDGEVLKIEDLERLDEMLENDELDEDVEYVALVSDHGNVELYSINRAMKSYEQVMSVV